MKTKISEYSIKTHRGTKGKKPSVPLFTLCEKE